MVEGRFRTRRAGVGYLRRRQAAGQVGPDLGGDGLEPPPCSHRAWRVTARRRPAAGRRVAAGSTRSGTASSSGSGACCSRCRRAASRGAWRRRPAPTDLDPCPAWRVTVRGCLTSSATLDWTSPGRAPSRPGRFLSSPALSRPLGGRASRRASAFWDIGNLLPLARRPSAPLSGEDPELSRTRPAEF